MNINIGNIINNNLGKILAAMTGVAGMAISAYASMLVSASNTERDIQELISDIEQHVVLQNITNTELNINIKDSVKIINGHDTLIILLQYRIDKLESY